MIDSFRNKFAFLSNFLPHKIQYRGMTYPSVEHAYQAAKAVRLNDKIAIRDCDTCREAKKLGQTVERIDDWDNKRLIVMEDLLRIKFLDSFLAAQLLSTGDSQLIEGNHWGDRFWGQVDGQGENHLGKLLMKIREDLQYAVKTKKLA